MRDFEEILPVIALPHAYGKFEKLLREI